MTGKAWMAAALAFVAASGAAAEPGAVVKTAGGALVGERRDGIDAFKGIPYAAPPVGALRWRPPAAPAAWNGTRDATRFGAACMQPRDRKEAWAQVGPTSEDCLFLNVWRPAAAGRYPVMVFLHGGGFTYGAAGVPLYDGARLARRGVIVVTLNYRLGLLGFFAHPALSAAAAGEPVGNYGIMDQVAALRWVRTNIAAFGGDPAQVTLFGESAGAGTVQLLMGSPAGAGLFARAVSQSGSGSAILPSLSKAEETGAALVAAAGLANATAEQLRALPAERLLGRSFPFRDGQVVVASPATAFVRGREQKVPLLIGSNSNEASLAANNDAYARLALGGGFNGFLQRYAAARPRGSAEAAKTDLIEDALSVLPSATIARLHAAAGAPAYLYYFDQVPVGRRAGARGADHGGEVEYLFGNPYDGAEWDADDKAVSERMGALWTAFAKSGTPAAPGMPSWPRVGASGPIRYLAIATPPAVGALTPLEEEVRRASLATTTMLWSKEP